MTWQNVHQLKYNKEEHIAPFIDENLSRGMNDVMQRQHLLDETFFVESINVNLAQVVKIWLIVNIAKLHSLH